MNSVQPQVLISDREVTVCAQVKIIRSRYGDYLGLPWAPGHEQEHPLFAEGGMHPVHCLLDFMSLVGISILSVFTSSLNTNSELYSYKY